MCTIGGLGRHIGRYIGRRSTIDRLSVDSRPIDRSTVDRYIGRQSTDSRPIYRPIVDRYIGRLSAYMSTEATHSTHDQGRVVQSWVKITQG